MFVSTTIYNETLLLDSRKAIYWPERKALLIADPHLGKVEHFRKAGIAIPGKAGLGNWRRLDGLIADHQPENIYFLGDLFHSDINNDWHLFENFLQKHKTIQFHLVAGNHDIMPVFVYKQAGIQWYAETFELRPFLLSHHPGQRVTSGMYSLCGHVHPGVRLFGSGKQYATLPCFYFGENEGILPAFGQFTGLYRIKPDRKDNIYVIAQDEVIAVT